jgi:hypothetical protein
MMVQTVYNGVITMQALRVKAGAVGLGMIVRFFRRLAVLLMVVIPPYAQAQTAKGCDAARAASMIGKPFSPELAEEAQRVSGASSVRAIGLDFPSSADSRPDRLNVEVDRARLVTGFRCG